MICPLHPFFFGRLPFSGSVMTLAVFIGQRHYYIFIPPPPQKKKKWGGERRSQGIGLTIICDENVNVIALGVQRTGESGAPVLFALVVPSLSDFFDSVIFQPPHSLRGPKSAIIRHGLKPYNV